jgi:DNA polymerase subunit Cdc27
LVTKRLKVDEVAPQLDSSLLLGLAPESAPESFDVAAQRQAAVMRDHLQDAVIGTNPTARARLAAVWRAAAAVIAAPDVNDELPEESSSEPPEPIAALPPPPLPALPKTKTTAAAFFASNNSSRPVEKAAVTAMEEKENHHQSKTSSSSSTPAAAPQQRPDVGDADDFVGDVDDSDQEEVAAVPVAKPGKQRVSRVILSDDDEEEEDLKVPKKAASRRKKVLPPVSGAMDVFATTTAKTAAESEDPAPRRRRRRKKLVTNTTTDAKGYLHTEQEEVWEEYSTDEEAKLPTVAKKPTTTAAKPVNRKQGNIMGFFKKK